MNTMHSQEMNKADFIGLVIQGLKSKLKSSSDNIDMFVKQLFGSTPDDLVLKRDVNDVIYHLHRVWKGFQKRPNYLENDIEIFRWQPGDKTKNKERLVINIISQDMPFIVDSFLGLLKENGLKPEFINHPVLRVTRDANGNLKKILTQKDAQNNDIKTNNVVESLVHCEIRSDVTDSVIKKLEKDIKIMIENVRFATSDWLLMREKMFEVTSIYEMKHKTKMSEQSREVDEFMHWIYDGHFTFLGYAEFDTDKKYDLKSAKIMKNSTLGLFKRASLQDIKSVFKGIDQSNNTDNVFGKMPLVINKASTISSVHRNVPMDVLLIKKEDQNGNPVGVRVFMGLFTSEAYDSSAKDIPMLRSKIEKVTEKADLEYQMHNRKALAHILDTLPRDELFQTKVGDLAKMSVNLLDIQQRQVVGVFMRNDIFNRFISCLVFVPNNSFNTVLCEKIKNILGEEMGASVKLVKITFGSYSMSLVHYKIDTFGVDMKKYSKKKIENKIIEISRSWKETLRNHMQDELSELEAYDLYDTYGESFGVSYKDRYDSKEALKDINVMQDILGDPSHKTKARVYRGSSDGQNCDEMRLKIYRYGASMPLSDVIPILENLDLRVIGEDPHIVSPKAVEQKIWIHDFQLSSRGSCYINLDRSEAKLIDTLYEVLQHKTENDGFNRLVLTADLTCRAVSVVRGYCHYLRQIGINFNNDYIQDILLKHPEIVTSIKDLFNIKFNPEINGSAKKIQEASDKARMAIDKIVNADEDMVLRRVLNLVESTVRTNFYQKDKDGKQKDYISYKLSSRDITNLPLPRPLFEIFVHGKDVEGIHLRGGKVARGGLRWSDRPQDYRTEVLGLMKAQMVKNTVIVPVGSKGGFVIKKDTTGLSREEFFALGVKSYQTFINGLLDLTDNLKAGKVVHPKDVVRHDEDDTYLVVAADKGTATFSDYANEISVGRDFWLGDAFASGGSNGYDHKKMGITAKGAWESVHQHFLRMGVNTQKNPITVTGIGGMAGDVFGNGMLLSNKIRLKFAFNHLHIFIDPNPDENTSYKERKRLFDKVASWDEYNEELISKGGGIFSRSDKYINISKEAQEALGIDEKKLRPTELINRILKAPVDLMWFGGIGTYIKNSSEANSAIGDKANDLLRINGNELRAKVIGEGANMAVTHKGRIEFAENGGRLNTDFIDNSAGVDCSDHEVNIKILLNNLVREGKLSMNDRNKILIQMTDEVESLVLNDNIEQNIAISFVESQGVSLLNRHQNLMRILERSGRLNREIEFLPNEKKLKEYYSKGIGLSRPELSTLLSYAKMDAFDDLVKSDLMNDKFFESALIGYFPTKIQDKYKADALKHPLHKEIIATAVSNEILNRMGPSFFTELKAKTGRPYCDIACAYYISDILYGFENFWQIATSKREEIGYANMLKAIENIWQQRRRAVSWILNNYDKSDLERVSVSAKLEKDIQDLRSTIINCLNKEIYEDLNRHLNDCQNLGVDTKMSKEMAITSIATSSPDIILVSNATGYSVKDTAGIYFGIGARFGFNKLRSLVLGIQSNTATSRLAISSVIEELFHYQSEISKRVIEYAKSHKIKYSGLGETSIKSWQDNFSEDVERADYLLNMINVNNSLDMETAIVLLKEFKHLAGK